MILTTRQIFFHSHQYGTDNYFKMASKVAAKLVPKMAAKTAAIIRNGNFWMVVGKIHSIGPIYILPVKEQTFLLMI